MDCKIAFTATLLLMTWGTAAQGIPNPCPNAKPVPPERLCRWLTQAAPESAGSVA